MQLMLCFVSVNLNYIMMLVVLISYKLHYFSIDCCNVCLLRFLVFVSLFPRFRLTLFGQEFNFASKNFLKVVLCSFMKLVLIFCHVIKLFRLFIML